MSQPFILRNAEKNRELQLKHEAFENAEKAASAVTQAHASMRAAGMGGCREALHATQAALKDAQGLFLAAYQAERDRIEKVSRDHVETHREPPTAEVKVEDLDLDAAMQSRDLARKERTRMG